MSGSLTAFAVFPLESNCLAIITGSKEAAESLGQTIFGPDKYVVRKIEPGEYLEDIVTSTTATYPANFWVGLPTDPDSPVVLCVSDRAATQIGTSRRVESITLWIRRFVLRQRMSDNTLTLEKCHLDLSALLAADIHPDALHLILKEVW